MKDIDLSQFNCVMTDVFISMNDQESESKVNLLKNYIVNDDLMQKPIKIVFLCIVYLLKLVLKLSEEVFESSKSIVWRQAYNRMVAQKNFFSLFINRNCIHLNLLYILWI